MRAFYGLGVRLMFAVMWVAQGFHPKAKKWIQGRRKLLSGIQIPADQQVAWFHCASLGEFDQGLPVMNAYKERFPERFLVVTFFSPSGMDNYHKRDHQVDLAIYLPLDTKRKAVHFIAQIKPKDVFFVKYEFWYNHLKAARRAGANIYGVSSLFRPSHRFFKWYGGFFRKALALFDHFFTQDQRSLDLLKSIGITQATVTGDTRYDRMIALTAQAKENDVIEVFTANKPTIILGSTWPLDEEILFPALEELREDYRIIIAPHQLDEKHITTLIANFSGDAERYTQFRNLGKRVLILDTIGHLSSAYRYAQYAYVSGGFTGKLHNILEPGAVGIPIFIGPKHERFPEAQLFIDAGVAFVVNDATEFQLQLTAVETERLTVRSGLQNLFEKNAGAAKRVIAFLETSGK